MVKEFPTPERWDGVVTRLTEREREVVLLIGRFNLGYKAAAARLQNKHRNEKQGISARTVRQYATQIRDAMGSALPPWNALHELYFVHQSSFDEAA